MKIKHLWISSGAAIRFEKKCLISNGAGYFFGFFGRIDERPSANSFTQYQYFFSLRLSSRPVSFSCLCNKWISPLKPKKAKPTHKIVQLACQYPIAKNIVVMVIRPKGLAVALNPK